MSHHMRNQQSAYAKTKTQISCAVTAHLLKSEISSFEPAYRPNCVGPGRKLHCWFSHAAAHKKKTTSSISYLLSRKYMIKYAPEPVLASSFACLNWSNALETHLSRCVSFFYHICHQCSHSFQQIDCLNQSDIKIGAGVIFLI